MKESKIIIIAVLALLVVALVVIYLSSGSKIFQKKLTCTINYEPDVENPQKMEIKTYFKDNKVDYVDVKITYNTEDEAKFYCDALEDSETKYKCKKNTITLYKTSEYTTFEGESFLQKEYSDYKKSMESIGYKCK